MPSAPAGVPEGALQQHEPLVALYLVQVWVGLLHGAKAPQITIVQEIKQYTEKK